jgi:hypothetical protein
VVRNLPEVKSLIPLLVVSSTDSSLQGASTSSKPTVGEVLGHLVCKVGGFLLANKALYVSARGKIKKAKASAREAGTAGIQQLGNAGGPKKGDPRLKPLKGQGQRAVPPQKRLEL